MQIKENRDIRAVGHHEKDSLPEDNHLAVDYHICGREELSAIPEKTGSKADRYVGISRLGRRLLIVRLTGHGWTGFPLSFGFRVEVGDGQDGDTIGKY